MIDQLAKLGAEKMGVSAEELTAAESFDDLGLDSLALLEFSVAIQKQFAITLDEEAIVPEQSLSDVKALVLARQVSQNA